MSDGKSILLIIGLLGLICCPLATLSIAFSLADSLLTILVALVGIVITIFLLCLVLMRFQEIQALRGKREMPDRCKNAFNENDYEKYRGKSWISIIAGFFKGHKAIAVITQILCVILLFNIANSIYVWNACRGIKSGCEHDFDNSTTSDIMTCRNCGKVEFRHTEISNVKKSDLFTRAKYKSEVKDICNRYGLEDVKVSIIAQGYFNYYFFIIRCSNADNLTISEIHRAIDYNKYSGFPLELISDGHVYISDNGVGVYVDNEFQYLPEYIEFENSRLEDLSEELPYIGMSEKDIDNTKLGYHTTTDMGRSSNHHTSTGYITYYKWYKYDNQKPKNLLAIATVIDGKVTNVTLYNESNELE